MKQEDSELDTAQTDALEREEHADYIEAEVRQSESQSQRASTIFKDKGTTRESEDSRRMARNFAAAMKVSDDAAGGPTGVLCKDTFMSTASHHGALSWFTGTGSGWEPVFCALKNSFIFIFSGSDVDALNGNPTHAVNLRSLEAIMDSFDDHDRVKPYHGKEFGFKIIDKNHGADGMSFTLAASSKEEAEKWCDWIHEELLTGKVKDISDEDRAVLDRFKKSLPVAEQGHLGTNYFYSDVSLMRFIELAGKNPTKAREQFLSAALWRKQMNLDKMTIKNVADLAAKGAFIAPGVYDLVGRPVIFLMNREQAPGEDSTLHLTRCLTYALERATHQFKEDGPFEVTMVCNLVDVSLTQFDERFQRNTLDIFLNKYPGVPGAGVFYNTPTVIRWVMGLITSIAPKKMQDQFHFFRGGSEVLSNYISLDDVPKQFFDGNNESITVENYIAERAKLEGVVVRSDMQADDHDLDPAILAQLKTLYCVAKDLPDIAHSGWITKKGGIIFNWKKRFAVLRAGMLYYFKGEDYVDPQGVILLENTKARIGEKISGKPHIVEVITPTRTWVLSCSTEEQANAWVAAINKECYDFEE